MGTSLVNFLPRCLSAQAWARTVVGPLGRVFAVAAMMMACPPTGEAQTSVPWAKIWTADNSYYVHNNVYSIPAAGTQSVWLTNDNSWGADWNFNGQTGATYPSIVYGQWPWSPDVTNGSGMPIKISDAGNYYVRWAYTKSIAANSSWNSAIEIWTHSATPVSGSNITCDIMIEPNYTASAGSFVETITVDGVQYDVYAQVPPETPGYEIIHFKRKTKTDDTGRIRVNPFWDYCVTKGYASNSDWISTIDAGLEPFNNSGSFTTTTFFVQREKYEAEQLPWTSVGTAWDAHASAIAGSSNAAAHDSGCNSVNDSVTFTARVFDPGIYTVSTRFYRGPVRGRFQLYVDGVLRGGVADTYSATHGYTTEFSHGTVNLTKGLHQFQYKVTGKNASSSSYQGTVDYIRLVK